MTTSYGVMTDYDYGSEHKRDRIVVWSGPFMSAFEAEGYSVKSGYMLTTYNGDKVRVKCPTPRDDSNYRVVDRAVSEALNAHYAAKGATRLMEGVAV